MEFLKDYKTPESLSNNFMDYIFRLENKLYSLPAPVSEFVNDGWEITAQPDSITAGNEIVSGLRMKKGNTELSFTVKNFSNVEVESKDWMITGVFINNEFLNNLDFELSGGITFGISSSDLESKVDISQFTVENSSSGITEYSHIENSNRTFLTFNNDKLTGVNIAKNTLS